jgi:hypothetical protein
LALLLPALFRKSAAAKRVLVADGSPGRLLSWLFDQSSSF